MMPGLIANEAPGPLRERAMDLLQEVGLGHRIEHPVGKLSGGERQRVAVARAVVREPALLLADEPTGNLDPKSGDQVLELLLDLTRTHHSGLVVVTHSPQISERLGRSLVLAEGYIADLGAFTDPSIST
jgi:lipoprotein-releasing system ATP-binding protein